MRRTSNATFNNFKWSKADHDLMVALLKEGKNYAQIAKCLGRSIKSIEQHAYQARKKLKDSGMSEERIAELIPTNPRPRPKITRQRKSVTKEPEAHNPAKYVKQDSPTPKEEPLIYSGGALFESQIGNLLIASAACALGIWLLVGIFIASLF